MNKKIRVAMILPNLCTGGGQKVALDIAKNLGDNFEVIFISLGSKGNDIFNQYLDKNFKVIYLNKRYGFDPMIIIKLLKIFKFERIEIVHTHLQVLPYVLFGTIFNRIKGRIHTIHSMADKEFNIVIRKIMKFSFKYLNFIPVAICDSVKNSIELEYNIKEKNIPVIYNGVDINKFRVKKDRNIKDTINIINVGSMWYPKNHSLLVEAFSKALARNKKLRLTILGDGELKPNIEDLIKKLNIEKYVFLPGNVMNVEEYLNESDIFILSSKFEGLPLVILEAMASGLPIISTNVGGISDIVKNNENGFLVDSDNVGELAEAIIKLSKDYNLINNFGEISKSRSIIYDVKIMANKYKELYYDLISSNMR
ncbi:glycosyltransferase [Clostridium perfringens]|nr:glycosyltransferase [Clostridium perfringens]